MNASHAWLCNAFFPSPMSPLGTKCLSWWRNRFGCILLKHFLGFFVRWDIAPILRVTGLPQRKACMSRFSYTEATNFWMCTVLLTTKCFWSNGPSLACMEGGAFKYEKKNFSCIAFLCFGIGPHTMHFRLVEMAPHSHVPRWNRGPFHST